MTRSEDIELRTDIVAELEWDPSIDARKIGVAVEDGIVALTGHVESYAAQKNAEKIVKRVHGVLGLANELTVKIPAGAERDDVDVVRSVIHALDWNVAIPKNRIKAAVTSGLVTLEGDLEWQYQKRAAEETVRMLAGVRGVINKIVVKARTPRAEDVKGKIKAALRRIAEVDSGKITVEANDGTVTLGGTVRSWIEREDAINAAWSAPGVVDVVDQIHIRS